jgi:hypothetical protein
MTRNQYTLEQIEEMKTVYAWYVKNGLKQEGNILALTIKLWENPELEEAVLSEMYARYKAIKGFD